MLTHFWFLRLFLFLLLGRIHSGNRLAIVAFGLLRSRGGTFFVLFLALFCLTLLVLCLRRRRAALDLLPFLAFRRCLCCCRCSGSCCRNRNRSSRSLSS